MAINDIEKLMINGIRIPDTYQQRYETKKRLIDYYTDLKKKGGLNAVLESAMRGGILGSHPGKEYNKKKDKYDASESVNTEKNQFLMDYVENSGRGIFDQKLSAIERAKAEALRNAQKFYDDQYAEILDKDTDKFDSVVTPDNKKTDNKKTGTITPVGYYDPSRLPGKMGGEEQRNWESLQRRKDKKYEPTFFKEDPGFVDKKTFLEKIMDKRIKPGEELSNAAKTRLYLKEISQNLLEHRKKGGKEGTDTLARIFGGIREGEEAVTAKEEGIVTRREAGIDKRLDRDKTVANITKIYAEATKAQSEAFKHDFPEEWQMFALEAAANNLEPGSQPFNDYIVKNLQQKRLLATGKGAGDMYTTLAELQAQLAFTPPGDARDQLQANIDNLLTLMPGLGTTSNQTENNSISQTELMEGEEE